MSDPMTNLDADDVLASIRRLVAETHGQGAVKRPHVDESRPATVSPEAPETKVSPETDRAVQPASVETASGEADSVKEPPVREALVLTPAFRVAQPVEETIKAPTAEAATNSANAQEPDAAEQAKASANVTPLVLSAELAVHVPKTEAEPAATSAESSDETTDGIEDLVVSEIMNAPLEDPEPEEQDWTSVLDDTPDEVAAAHVARLTLEQRIAELEAAVGAQAADWEPDGSEDLEAEIPREMPRGFGEPGARVLHFRTRDVAREDPLAEGHEEQRVESREEDEPAMTLAEDVSDQIDDAEIIEETPAQEDVSSAAPVSQVAVEADFVEDAEEEPAIAADPDPSLDEELALAGYADEDILDEEALRELVAQVIREELQGALGERITSNVRRLVRREVQRALTLREFE